jgi:hypothetical protein
MSSDAYAYYAWAVLFTLLIAIAAAVWAVRRLTIRRDQADRRPVEVHVHYDVPYPDLLKTADEMSERKRQYLGDGFVAPPPRGQEPTQKWEPDPPTPHHRGH